MPCFLSEFCVKDFVSTFAQSLVCAEPIQLILSFAIRDALGQSPVIQQSSEEDLIIFIIMLCVD